MEIESRLNTLLPDERMRLLRLVGGEAASQGMPLYILGGTVRDLLLERKVGDFDLVVEGNAIDLAHKLASRHGGKVTAHSKFGTAKWILPEALKPGYDPDDTLDIITARSEIYEHPGALPTVRPGTLEDDIRRRDFTINSLALRLDGEHFGEVRDDLGGLEDLRNGLIRVLHPRSFIDDPTRMYRAVRYEKRNSFRIADDTLALIPGARVIVENLSQQRIRNELDLILDEPNAAAMLARLDELGLLTIIHPSLGNFKESRLAQADSDNQNRRDRWILWLMHLPESELAAINRRVHFTAELLKVLRSASLLYAKRGSVLGLSPSKAVDVLDGYALSAIERVAQVAEDEVRQVLSKYLAEWRHIKPKTTGHDLKVRGIESGPKYTEILRRLRSAWLDGEIQSSEDEAALLATLIE